jgi:hypothetical protein
MRRCQAKMQAGFNSFASYRRVAVNDTPVTDERQKKVEKK